MSTAFLTDDELADLTGLRQAAAQIRWLRKNKVKVYERADGKPRVPRWAVESREDRPQVGQVSPNFEALRAAR